LSLIRIEGFSSGFKNPIAFYPKGWQKIIMKGIIQGMGNLLFSIRRISYLLVLFCMLLTAVKGPAWTGGLYIGEFGTPSMGVAAAGAQAVASDASTAFHNPAGMTRIKGKELMLTGGALYSTVKFDKDANTPIGGGNGGEAGGPAPILGQFYVHSLTDRLKLGANIISMNPSSQ